MNLLQYWYCFYYILVFQPGDVGSSLPTCSPSGFSVHGNFPGKNTGGGCHFLRQGIFQTQGLNLCLLSQQADSLLLEPTGKPLTPSSGIKLVPSALEGEVITPGPPGKFHKNHFYFNNSLFIKLKEIDWKLTRTETLLE